MKKSFVITIAVIVLIPLVLLGLSFGLDGLAQANAQKEHVRLMETLLPGGTDFRHVAYDGEDDIIRDVHQCDTGFVIKTATYGYAGEIVMLIGVDNQGQVMGLVTLEAHETEGLGNRILTDHAFLAQFLHKNGSFTIGTPGVTDSFSGATGDSTPADDAIYVDGISGATVSSKAVARCVSAAVAYVTGADIGSSATEWGG